VTVSCLTDHGDDDDDEVEDVPRLLEVIPAQRQQLHEALHREDAHKHQIHVSERVVQCARHLVVFECHGDHIQKDNDHDAGFEAFVSDQLEEKSLKLKLSQIHNARSKLLH